MSSPAKVLQNSHESPEEITKLFYINNILLWRHLEIRKIYKLGNMGVVGIVDGGHLGQSEFCVTYWRNRRTEAGK